MELFPLVWLDGWLHRQPEEERKKARNKEKELGLELELATRRREIPGAFPACTVEWFEQRHRNGDTWLIEISAKRLLTQGVMA